jgi:hypothetical protein
VLDRYQLIRIPADVHQVSHLPFTILPTPRARHHRGDCLCLYATIIRPGQAARLDPAQALRYERRHRLSLRRESPSATSSAERR